MHLLARNNCRKCEAKLSEFSSKCWSLISNIIPGYAPAWHLGIVAIGKMWLTLAATSHPVVVLVSMQVVQMGAPILNLRALGATILVYVLSKIYEFC